MYPEHGSSVFGKLRDHPTPSKSTSCILKSRLAVVHQELHMARSNNNRVAQYYLQIFLDAHFQLIEMLHTINHWPLSSTIAQYPELLPECQPVIGQTALPDYLTSLLLSQAGTTPIEKLLMHIVHSGSKEAISPRIISVASKDPSVAFFIAQCHATSILGNYIHATMAPDYMLHINDRMRAFTDARKKTPIGHGMIYDILMDYIAGIAPLKVPPGLVPTHRWQQMITHATLIGNRTFRTPPLSLKAAAAAASAARATPAAAAAAAVAAAASAEDQHTTPVMLDPQEPQIPRTHSYIAAPTGTRFADVCIHCGGVVAYMRDRPHGIKPLKAYVDAFCDPTKPIVIRCIPCDQPTHRIYLQHVYLAIAKMTSLLVCPGCNQIHCIRGPIRTTLCASCRKPTSTITAELRRSATLATIPPDEPSTKKRKRSTQAAQPPKEQARAATRTCYEKSHKLNEQTQPIYQQLIYDKAINTIIKCWSCAKHFTNTIIISSNYTPALLK
jgi:hypothetical protein